MIQKKRVTKKVGKKAAKKAVARNTKKKTSKKSTARTAKKTIRKTPVKRSPIVEYELIISKASDQLRKAHANEVTKCEKTVTKLQAQTNRAMAKQKLQREKKAAAAERMAEKGTQAAKNQVVRSREALRLANETSKKNRAELKIAKQALTIATTAQKKFLAMEKQLARFERDWDKSAKPKRTTRKKTRRVNVTEVVQSTTDEPKVESPDSEQPEQTIS